MSFHVNKTNVVHAAPRSRPAFAFPRSGVLIHPLRIRKSLITHSIVCLIRSIMEETCNIATNKPKDINGSASCAHVNARFDARQAAASYEGFAMSWPAATRLRRMPPPRLSPQGAQSPMSILKRREFCKLNEPPHQALRELRKFCNFPSTRYALTKSIRRPSGSKTSVRPAAATWTRYPVLARRSRLC